jgi:hypothetical protein
MHREDRPMGRPWSGVVTTVAHGFQIDHTVPPHGATRNASHTRTTSPTPTTSRSMLPRTTRKALTARISGDRGAATRGAATRACGIASRRSGISASRGPSGQHSSRWPPPAERSDTRWLTREPARSSFREHRLLPTRVGTRPYGRVERQSRDHPSGREPRLFSVAYVSDELRSIHGLAKLLAYRRDEREDND